MTIFIHKIFRKNLAIFILTFSMYGQKALSFEPPPPPFLKGKIFLRHSETFRNKMDLNSSNKGIENNKSNSQVQIPLITGQDESLTFNYRQSLLGFNPDQANYPDVYDINYSLSYSRQSDEKSSWGTTLGYGSNSDKPFTKSSDINYGLTLSYTRESTPVSKWTWLLVYSSQRSFLKGIPLPGFIYNYEPSSDFKVNAGLPFFTMNYQMNEKWGTSIFLLVPFVYRTSVNYKIFGPFQASIGIESSEDSYLLVDRTATDERLYFREKKAFVAARIPLSLFYGLELEAGSSYERTFYKSEKFSFYPERPEFIESSNYFKASAMVYF